jgi:lipoprotein-anchoring transpeptidase ErfK/SrfK
MQGLHACKGLILIALASVLTACATQGPGGYRSASYSSRLPQQINTGGEKVVVVDPKVNAWGAYGRDGKLVRAGIATAGNSWCSDIGRPCRTHVGTFRVRSLGSASCKSSIYPKPHGGGLMPYCMFFSGGQALHGSPDGAVVESNVSHGCVRMRIPDAEWMRFEFANVGTKVIVKPYGGSSS